MRLFIPKVVAATAALLLCGATAPALAAPTAGSISGTVSSAFGPLSGASVIARDADSGAYIETTTTDPAGSYTLSQLPPARYFVTALDHGYAVPAPGYTAARVTAGSDTAGVDFTLDPGASIMGHVTTPAGADLAGANVLAINADAIKALVDYTLLQGAGAGLLIGLTTAFIPPNMTAMLAASPGFAQTDASGNYTIDGLRTGNYFVGATAAAQYSPSQTTVTIAAATDSPTVNIAFAAGANITGHVLTADGKPLADVAVSLTADNPSAYELFASSAMGVTDANGRYDITGVPAGSYTIGASANGLADIDTNSVLVTSVGQSITSDFALPGLNTVSGTVTDEQHNPVAHADVLLLGAANFAGTAQVVTDNTGHYQVQGLPDDTYDVSVAATGYITPADVNATVSSATPTATADFTVAKGATIRGIVRDPGGHPVYGAQVIAIPTDLNVGTFGYTSTLPDGSFEVPGLDVATYQVRVESTGFAAPPAANVPVVARTTDVTYDLTMLDLSQASVPGKPRIAATSARGSLNVMVASPVDDGGNFVTRYNVTVQPGNHKCSVYDANTCKVTGLLDGIFYAVDVSATNEVGTGSTAVMQVWTPAVPAVTGMKSHPGKKGQATVTFKAPKTPNTITNYKLEYRVGSKWKVFAHKVSRSTTILVKGLPAKKSFPARVTTVLKSGRALTSKTFTIKTG